MSTKSKRTVIALGHKAQTGKDTVGDYLVDEYGFEQVAFADVLKRGAMVIFGLSEEEVYGEAKKEVDPFWSEKLGREVTPGQLLQFMGTDLFREQFHPDIWRDSVVRKVQDNPEQDYVITDMRFPNETEVDDILGAHQIRVDRPDEERGDIGRPKDHISETAIDDYKGWDGVIDNSGTLADLHTSVDDLMLDINNGLYGDYRLFNPFIYAPAE